MDPWSYILGNPESNEESWVEFREETPNSEGTPEVIPGEVPEGYSRGMLE